MDPGRSVSVPRAEERSMKAETFTIDFGNTSTAKSSLQNAFSDYLRKKKPKCKRRRKRSRKKMAALREKFLAQALKYMGVPYAKRYYTSDDDEYNSPLFLDCCGLVRRVMYDLQKDFGFRIGPWNQAYMYDVLPKTLSGPQEMKPGDLVFVRGEYYNPNKRPQKHDITHVEIWMGDGDKSLGARWQRGRVQVFDSYAFESKSYKIVEYIFKSLDPWLKGHCKSHCSIHKWRPHTVRSRNKYSIFYDANDEKSDVAQKEQLSLSSTTESQSVADSSASNEVIQGSCDPELEIDEDADFEEEDCDCEAADSDGDTKNVEAESDKL